MTRFSPDKSISKTDEDIFERAPYAEKLAKAILEQPDEDSYAIGLYSRWGYGKTSVLQMIEEHLPNEKVILVKFNPWAYTTQDAMIKGLLVKLATQIAKATPQPKKWHSRVPVLSKQIEKRTVHGTISLTSALGDAIGQYAEITGVVNGNVGKGAKAISHLMTKDSMDTIRNRVEEKIRNSGKRVVVMIDDVDRLDKDEIFQLFKFIKVITDFKGITYLIAFDDIAVAKALNARFTDGSENETGRQYIEKIIQIPLHLPLIEQDRLDQLLFDGLEECLKEFNLKVKLETIETTFHPIYKEHIVPLMKTPRMVHRYINALKFTIPLTSDEVDLVDLLLIEAIRLLYPETYTELRYQKKLMTGTQRRDYFADQEDLKEKEKKKFEALTKNDEHLQGLLRSLFPHIERLYNEHHTKPTEEELRENKFVASVDYYDRYFTYGIGTSDVPDTEILKTLSLDDADSIASELNQLLDTKDADLIINKIKTYSSSAAYPVELARSLLQIGDKLPEKKSELFAFRFSPMEQVSELICTIINSTPDRLDNYKKIIDECTNLDQLTYLIREVVLGSEEKNDSKKATLNPIELEEFKKHVASKIRSESKKHILHEEQYNISYILYRYWQEYGSREETNQYLLKKLKNKDRILSFLTKHLGIWTGTGGSHRGNLENATFKSIHEIVDTEPLYNILVKANPEFKNTSEFPDLRDENNIGSIGNESKEEFRTIVQRQFIFQYEHNSQIQNSEE